MKLFVLKEMALEANMMVYARVILYLPLPTLVIRVRVFLLAPYGAILDIIMLGMNVDKARLSLPCLLVLVKTELAQE